MGVQADSPSADPTIYPEEEKVGEDLLQRLIVELLRPLVERWLTQQGTVALVGADQFIYYRQHDPISRYAPDVYVLPNVPPDTEVPVWKTWETGIAPSFALEIASKDWRKDYEQAPERSRAIGIDELVVFDRRWSERPGGEGARWQVWRKGKRGLRRVIRSDDDRIQSKVLGCWLRVVGVGSATRLRLGTGRNGEALFPTAEEAAKRDEQAAKRDKEAALARIAELEAELRKRD